MSTLDASPRWPVALGTGCVWAVAAASLMFWGLRLAAPPESAAPPAVAKAAAAVDATEVAKVLGGGPVLPTGGLAPDAGSRFVLLGVVADGEQRGAALIAVDGKAPRPFRVGQDIGDGYVLQSVDRRAVALGTRVDAPTSLTLQLPRPASVSGATSTAPRPGFAPVMAPVGTPAIAPAPSVPAGRPGAAAALR